MRVVKRIVYCCGSWFKSGTSFSVLLKLSQEDEVQNTEMSRFIPQQIREHALDNLEYWGCVQAEVSILEPRHTPL